MAASAKRNQNVAVGAKIDERNHIGRPLGPLFWNVTFRELGSEQIVNATPLIAGSRSRLQNHLPERGFTGPNFRVATIQPENSSTA